MFKKILFLCIIFPSAGICDDSQNGFSDERIIPGLVKIYCEENKESECDFQDQDQQSLNEDLWEPPLVKEEAKSPE